MKIPEWITDPRDREDYIENLTVAFPESIHPVGYARKSVFAQTPKQGHRRHAKKNAGLNRGDVTLATIQCEEKNE